MAPGRTAIEETADTKFADPGTYKQDDNKSTVKLHSMIRRYLEVVGGQHGGLYKGIRTSRMGQHLWSYYSGDVVAWGDDADVDQKKFNELMGIEWGFLADPAARLANVAKFATDDLNKEILDLVKKLTSAWPDKTGEFASRKLKQFASVCTSYGQTANAFAAVLGAPGAGIHDTSRKAIHAIVNFCNEGSSQFLDFMEGQSIGDLKDRLDAVETRLRLGVTYGTGLGTEQPYNTGNMLQQGLVINVPSTFGDRWYSDVEIERLRGYAEAYSQSIRAFRQLINAAHQAINAQMGGLPGMLPDDAWDPFEALKSDPKPDPAPQSSASTSPTGGGGGGSSYAGMPQYSPGAGTSAAGYLPPPETELPDTSLPATAGMTSASSFTNPPDQPETVTITDGNRQIAVQSPDGQGHVQVTVDDGSGKPKSYDMDFGDGTGSRSRSAAMTSGAGGPGTPGQTAQDGAGPASGGTRTGATSGPSEGDGIEHAKAGADGKVVVHDGPLTITAERPDGMPDQVKITVDDGTGHPTTYNVDYQDADNPSASSGNGPADGQQAATGGTTASPATGGHGESAVAQQGHPGQHADASGTGAPVPGAHLGTGTDSSSTAPTQSDSGSGSSAQSGAPVQVVTPQSETAAMPVGSAAGHAGHPGAGDQHHAGLAGTGVNGAVVPAAPGDAGLAAAPDAGQSHDSAAPAGMASMGGMPMMGAMGGAGGGSGGGDSERGGSGWRASGNLFEEDFDDPEDVFAEGNQEAGW